MALTRLEWVTLISMIILASILRLGYPGVNSFASDEARVSLLALQTVREGDIATNGISSSSGARNLPLSVYAFALPYVVSSDPLFATQWVGFWNVLTVVGVWWLARRVWGAWGAWLCGMVLACAPFAVFFSRNIWTQNFLIPLTVFWLLCAYCAFTSVRHKRLFFIGGAVFLASIAFQIHAAGITLIPLTLWFIVRDAWWRNWWVILVSATLAGIFLIPFLQQALCCHPELISEYTQTLGQGERRITPDALQFTTQIAINYGWHYLALGDSDTVARWIPLAIITGLTVLIAFFAWAWRGMPSPHAKTRELFVLALIIPILFFSVQSAPVRLHYLLPTLPIIALAMGAITRLPKQTVYALSIIIASITLVWSGQILASLAILDTQLVPNGMGMSLEVVRNTAQQLPKDRPIMVLTQSDDVVTRGEPATWATLLWDTPHRVIGGWTTLILPNEATTLFTDVNGMPAWEEVQVAGLATNEQTIQIFEAAPPSFWVSYTPQPLVGYTALDAPIVFENGLALVAWRYRVISGRLRISLVYNVVNTPPAVTIQQFTHLRTATTLDGAPPLTADIPLGAHNWRVGDTVISMADFLTFETDMEYWLDVGQYDLASGTRFGRQNGGDSVRLGAFVVQVSSG
jgi:hypothetical protein